MKNRKELPSYILYDIPTLISKSLRNPQYFENVVVAVSKL